MFPELLLQSALNLAPLPALATAAPPFRFLDPIAYVQPGPESGTAHLMLRLDSATSAFRAAPGAPEFKDLPLPTPLAAEVRSTGIVEMPGGPDKTRTWRLDLIVDGLEPSHAPQRRYATIQWGAQAWNLDYHLSTLPSADFRWDITGLAPEWNLNTDRCTGFQISQSSPASSGIVLSATLSEESSKSLLGPKLFLSAGVDPAHSQDGSLTAQAAIDLAANQRNTLYICATPDFVGSGSAHGKFVGTVEISSAQKPDGKSLSLTAYKAGHRWLGVLLMLVGTLTAYLLKVWVPASLARARELEPVVLLRERLGELEGHVANIPTAMVPVLSRRLKELTAALNDKELDAAHLLHRVPPLPFNDGVDTAKLAALLNDTSAKIALAGVVLVDGLLKAKELGSMAPAQHHLIFNAYKTIDGRLDQSPAPTPGEMGRLVQGDVASLRGQIQQAVVGAAAAPPFPGTTRGAQLTWERLQLSSGVLPPRCGSCGPSLRR